MCIDHRKFPGMRPLIILHELFESSETWKTIANNLTAKIPNKTVDPVDLIGHGMKYGLIESWQSMQRDLEWRFRLKEKEFDLMGHSFVSI